MAVIVILDKDIMTHRHSNDTDTHIVELVVKFTNLIGKATVSLCEMYLINAVFHLRDLINSCPNLIGIKYTAVKKENSLRGCNHYST